MLLGTVFLAFALFLEASAQTVSEGEVVNSFPHSYPGIPNQNADFGDHAGWQEYFRVKDNLTNIAFSLPRSFAGNLPVNRKDHPNDTLFFWGFEKSEGSLTKNAGENDDEPWGIWLNGGPGSSSMIGLIYENGPIHISGQNGSFVSNPASWNNVLDTFWVDQPVGVGHSTADSKGYINSEDDMGNDFMGFLSNLVQVFPSLQKRPFYLLGESYAGVYIPYIVKSYFTLSDRPVNLVKFAIGDGSINSLPFTDNVAMLNALETFPQLIDYNTEVYNYFKEQHHLCGYDLNLTYPQDAPLPPINGDNLDTPDERVRALTRHLRNPRQNARLFLNAVGKKAGTERLFQRDLTGRANGTIDPWFRCNLFVEVLSYAINFTKPWSNVGDAQTGEGFDVYDIPNVVVPAPPDNGDAPSLNSLETFLNDASVRAALHAPTSKDYSASIQYPFRSNLSNFLDPNTNDFGDPSPPPTIFLDELVKNMSEHDIQWVLYSGNDDLLVGHFGTEAIIQNITFGNTRGFSKRPQTPWFDKNGEMAGLIHQEHNLTYVLFKDAGHLIPQWQPDRALIFLQEFVLGHNRNGTVQGNGSVVGGDGFSYGDNVLPAAHSPIFTGSGTTQGSTIWPSATIEAWDSFIATATAASSPNSGSDDNGGSNVRCEVSLIALLAAVGIAAIKIL